MAKVLHFEQIFPPAVEIVEDSGLKIFQVDVATLLPVPVACADSKSVTDSQQTVYKYTLKSVC